MLDVVQHQERPPLAQGGVERRARVQPRHVPRPQRAGDGGEDERGVAERRERHPGDAVGEGGARLCGDAQRQARLAHPARPGQRE
ncbi:MAG TPA: hypothetical protein VFL91_27840 [Thermomicrobiales bacterium]|nr:hypothetical protein [Thermomicrobiales bacterium]